MNRTLIIASVLALAAAWSLVLPDVRTASCAVPGTAQAEENWKSEFDDVCSRTQDAMSFSTAELKVIVARCDAIKPQIERLPDESRRKVTLRRLQMCRDLFAYVLQTRENK